MASLIQALTLVLLTITNLSITHASTINSFESNNNGLQNPLRLRIANNNTNNECNCTGITHLLDGYICGDPRLGPIKLPRVFPLLDIVSTYDRFNYMTPIDFLAKWWDANKTGNYMGINGAWSYPPHDGFLTGGDEKTIVWANTTLQVGTVLDRFGSERGRYLAAADAPFSQRALPPSSLNHGDDLRYASEYHVYEVVKPLPVLAGIIAPYFGQPGMGAQFYIGGLAPGNKGNVTIAKSLGYIEERDKWFLTKPGEVPEDVGKVCGRT